MFSFFWSKHFLIKAGGRRLAVRWKRFLHETLRGMNLGAVNPCAASACMEHSRSPAVTLEWRCRRRNSPQVHADKNLSTFLAPWLTNLWVLFDSMCPDLPASTCHPKTIVSISQALERRTTKSQNWGRGGTAHIHFCLS